MPPSVPPTPMNPNSRFPCSLRNTSTSTAQNVDTTNRLYTLVQTKNARPTQTRCSAGTRRSNA